MPDPAACRHGRPRTGRPAARGWRRCAVSARSSARARASWPSAASCARLTVSFSSLSGPMLKLGWRSRYISEGTARTPWRVRVGAADHRRAVAGRAVGVVRAVAGRAGQPARGRQAGVEEHRLPSCAIADSGAAGRTQAAPDTGSRRAQTKLRGADRAASARRHGLHATRGPAATADRRRHEPDRRRRRSARSCRRAARPAACRWPDRDRARRLAAATKSNMSMIDPAVASNEPPPSRAPAANCPR